MNSEFGPDDDNYINDNDYNIDQSSWHVMNEVIYVICMYQPEHLVS